jgi:long-chain acyl-CoA synthetase
MYPGLQAKTRPDQPAIIMARSGETITYRELDERSNRLAHLLRAAGLKRGDHFCGFHGEPNIAGDKSAAEEKPTFRRLGIPRRIR